MKIVICETCNAENEIETVSSEVIPRCENCDNDLIRQKLKVRVGGNPYLLEETINSLLAKLYFFVFGVALTLYLLSHIGVTVNLDAFGIDFSILYIIMHMPAVFHLGVLRYLGTIKGIYKGTNKYYMQRLMLLIALMVICYLEFSTNNFNLYYLESVYSMMMVISFILFNAHYFGKKGNAILS